MTTDHRATEMIRIAMDDLEKRIGQPLSYWVCMRIPNTTIDVSVQGLSGTRADLDHARMMKQCGKECVSHMYAKKKKDTG